MAYTIQQPVKLPTRILHHPKHQQNHRYRQNGHCRRGSGPIVLDRGVRFGGRARVVRHPAVVVLFDNKPGGLRAIDIYVGHVRPWNDVRTHGTEWVTKVAVRSDAAAKGLTCANVSTPEHAATSAVAAHIGSVMAVGRVAEKHNGHHYCQLDGTNLGLSIAKTCRL